jgi:mitogen-activated protein kinase 1/3
MIDAKRMLREIRILNEFKHENIISLERVIFNEHPKLDFGEVYLVSNLMDVDLNTLIKKSKNDLTDDHIQYIMYQIFRSLKFLHSGGVIHRDIKPSNILANESCDIRVCDFGFARDAGEDTANVELTEYVVTRFYRAPEVMLSSQRYTTVTFRLK